MSIRAITRKRSALKQSLLAFALAAGLGSALPAQAVHLSDSGIGQVLLFPYYTVNGGNQTLISIVNTTFEGKALRLFFREGQNGRVTQELTLYLSPFDVWTASLFSIDASGAANLVTQDNTCTIPRVKGNTQLPALPGNGNRYLAFANTAYTGANNDAGSDGLQRTREGYFEVIELGEVINLQQNSWDALVHDSTGVPQDCAQLRNAWSPAGSPPSPQTYWSNDPSTDMAPPGGGLSGMAFVVDVMNGSMQGYAADAIDQFSTEILHTPPGTGTPTLAFANQGLTVATIDANLFVDGEAITLSYPAPAQSIDAISALLMADALHNEFVTSASVGGASEWVVTFPTKPFYTEDGIVGPIAPFSSVFPRNGEIAGAPEPFMLDLWTRDGVKRDCIPPLNYSGCIVGVPPPNAPIELRWVSNVIRFNQGPAGTSESSILGSTLLFDIDPFDPFGAGSTPSEGSARLSFWDATTALAARRLRADVQGFRLRGLPVQGVWMARYTNGQLTPGVLANYADALRHQTHSSIEAPSPAGFATQGE